MKRPFRRPKKTTNHQEAAVLPPTDNPDLLEAWRAADKATREWDAATEYLGSKIGRLMLISNFGSFPKRKADLYSYRLARVINEAVFAGDLPLGISAHASLERRQYFTDLDLDPFDYAAEILQDDLSRLRPDVIGTEGPPFDYGLGLASISKAAQESTELYGIAAGDVGHIAIVSGFALREVNLGYPEGGLGFLLEGIDSGKNGPEFTWRTIDPHPKR